MTFKVTLNKRRMTRKQRNGSSKKYDRYVVAYNDPKTGKRRQLFFEKQKEAYNEQRRLIAAYEEGTINNERSNLTVAQAFEYWYDDRKTEIKKQTQSGYNCYRSYIVGPLLSGTRQDRFLFSYKNVTPPNAKFLPMLGHMQRIMYFSDVIQVVFELSTLKYLGCSKEALNSVISNHDSYTTLGSYRERIFGKVKRLESS